MRSRTFGGFRLAWARANSRAERRDAAALPSNCLRVMDQCYDWRKSLLRSPQVRSWPGALWDHHASFLHLCMWPPQRLAPQLPFRQELQNHEPTREQQKQWSGRSTGKVSTSCCCDSEVTDAVAEFKKCPEPDQHMAPPSVQPHGNCPAPHPKSHEGGIRHQEAQRQISADQAAHEARRGEEYP